MRDAGIVSRFAVAALASLLAGGCTQVSNSPHARGAEKTNTLFTAFLERSPKYLDPTSSYSNDETPYTYQVYEPLYGYHYLKRPYQLAPRAAAAIAPPHYFDKAGKELPLDAPGEAVAQTVYDVPLQKGILFAPHPAFAKDAAGAYAYHALRREDVAGKHRISDFPLTGTRELTAHDYVYAIRRLATPRIKSPSFSLMSEYIVGLKDYATRIAAADHALRKDLAPTDRDLPMLDFRDHAFEGAEAIDRYTLRVRINGKYPQFKYWLAMTFFSPIPWEAEKFYSQPGMAEKNLTLNYWPVGTGPFMLTEFQENRRHVLERNPNFRGQPYPCEGEPKDAAQGLLEDCGKRTPFVDRIVFSIEKEAIPLKAKFFQGYYDSPLIERLDQATDYLVEMADSEDKSAEYRRKGIRLPTTIEANSWYIGFNMLDPVVGWGKAPAERERNRKLRQALSIAIDWEEHIQIFEKGQGMVAQGPLPPGLFGYRDDGPAALDPVVYRRVNGQLERRPIEDAKRLLAEAGYPDGRDAKSGQPLVLSFDYQRALTPEIRPKMQWYQKQFAKIGVQLEIRATDYNRFQDKMIKGNHQIFFWGWLADYPDAENFLFLLYGPNAKALTNGNGENVSNYQSPEFDRRYEAMKYEDDGPAKARLIDEMIAIAQEDAVWSWGYFPTSAAAFHQWVYNGKPTQIIRNHLQYLRVDPKLRAAKIAEWNRPTWWPVALIALALVVSVVPAVRAYRRRERENAARALAVRGAAEGAG
ncbi:MAG: peptide ABC transporter substrate-binding protein [Betaproteobacteria bacterium RIFCSPLOWO2_02_FULL_66_14]|nr:MAG: peptide ABC transporter substrate-binding protein [Betaproteobacteria bacterium RIFCSPLOWO2_02_FULL_66_14]